MLFDKKMTDIRCEVVKAMHEVKARSKGRYYPAWFALPKSKIRRSKHKTKELATVIPGDRSTYVFRDEEAYLGDYAASRYGWTWKKAGWDCMRHVEILGAGCVPLFKDIHGCPADSMVGYPKALFQSIYNQWREADTKGCQVDPKVYAGWQEALDKHFYAVLTCGAMMSLTHACVFGFGAERPKKVLFIDDRIPVKPDYLSMMVLVGIYEAWPDATIHVPFDVPYLYSDASGPLHKLYGRGFSYVRSLDVSAKQPSPSLTDALKDVASYDLVIYGSVKRSQAGLFKVAAELDHAKIWLFCGADRQPHLSRLNLWASLGTVFMREADCRLLP